MRVTDVCYEQDEPIDEDRARALAVNEVLRPKLSAFLSEQYELAKRSAIAGAVIAGIGVFALFSNMGATFSVGLLALGVAVGGGGVWYARSQEPDITVTGMQKAHWTGYCIPDATDGVLVYDATAQRDPVTFDLELLEDQSDLDAAQERLHDVEDYPVVMPKDRNLEAEIRETLESVQEAVDGATSHTVEAPLLSDEDAATNAVDFLIDRADADTIDAQIEVDPDDAKADVRSLDELESMANDADDGVALDEISDVSRTVAADLSGLQETAFDLLNDHIGTAADAYGLVSYHFYCPACLRDDIETRLAFTPAEADDEQWYCESCRDEFATLDAVPRHRLKDDLVNPIWDQLWIEKDDERREIYENIEDQKNELEEREFEQRSEEIRTTTDRIRDLRSRIRDLKTQAKAAEGTVEEIGDLMVKYEHLHEERKEEFHADVADAFEEIDEKTQEILEQTRNEEQERIEEAQEAAKEKAELMREEERKREREKFIAEQQMANARTQAIIDNQQEVGMAMMEHESQLAGAEMALEADLTEKEMKQEAKHQRQDILLDTRGRVYASDTINKGRVAWDKLTGKRKKGGGD